jgi:hypothetical protein
MIDPGNVWQCSGIHRNAASGAFSAALIVRATAPDIAVIAGAATGVITPLAGTELQVINAIVDMLNLAPNNFPLYAFTHPCGLSPSRFW